MSGPSITPTTPGATKPSAPLGQVVQIQSLPDALKSVSRAMHLQGEVVRQNPDGSTRMRTEQGEIDIQVRGRQPQPGAKVELDIPAGNPPRQATIRPVPVPAPQVPAQTTPLPTTTTPQPAPLPSTPVTSQPPATGTGTPSVPQDSVDVSVPTPPLPGNPKPTVPVETPQKAVPALPSIAAGDVIEMIPLRTADGSSPPTVLGPDGKPIIFKDGIAQPVLTKPVTVTVPAPAQSPVKPQGFMGTVLQAVKSVFPAPVLTAPSAVPIANSNATPLPALSQQAMSPAPILQTAPLLAKVTTLTMPGGQMTFAPAAAATMQGLPVPVSAQPITLQVLAQTPDNHAIVPLVMSADGAAKPIVQNFVIRTPASLPTGAQMTLMPLWPGEPATAPSGMMTPTTGLNTPSIPTQTAFGITTIPAAWRPLVPLMQATPLWPVMDDLFQSFYQATPQAAQILGRIIPSPANAQNFGPAAMLFAAALKSGELQAWIGDKKLDMIHKLGKDSLISRLSGEASSLPQAPDAVPSDWKSVPIPLLWQNEISKVMFHVRGETPDNEKDNGENATRFILDLSLTRMGDVQLDGLVHGKRLDVILRTQIPVSVSMQEALKVAYAKALDGSDIYGEMTFQNDLKHWMHVVKRAEQLGVSA